jgi:hypothetical protein
MKKPWLAIIIGFIITILVIFAGILVLFFLPVSNNSVEIIAEVTKISAPTSTPIVRYTWIPSPTPLPTEAVAQGKGFQIGNFAQIVGTDGEGLRLRSGPGRSNSVNFIGLDNEVFRIIEGPVEADGFSWWRLEAPYDASRNGWSVQDYLQIVTSP